MNSFNMFYLMCIFLFGTNCSAQKPVSPKSSPPTKTPASPTSSNVPPHAIGPQFLMPMKKQALTPKPQIPPELQNLQATRQYYLYDGILFDLKNKMLYMTSNQQKVQNPNKIAQPQPMIFSAHSNGGQDLRGAAFDRFKRIGSIAAYDIPRNKVKWLSHEAIVPLHIYKNFLVAYGKNDRAMDILILNINDGSVAKRFPNISSAIKESRTPCGKSGGTSNRIHVGGMDKYFIFGTSSYSCPIRPAQGIRQTHDMLQARMAECSSSEYGTFINLDNLKTKQLHKLPYTDRRQMRNDSVLWKEQIRYTIEQKCLSNTSYNCRQKQISYVIYNKEGKETYRQLLLEKALYAQSNFTIDGRHAIIKEYISATKSHKTTIFKLKNNKRINLAPEFPHEKSYIKWVDGNVLLAMGPRGFFVYSITENKILWHFEKPMIPQPPPCQNVPRALSR